MKTLDDIVTETSKRELYKFFSNYNSRISAIEEECSREISEISRSELIREFIRYRALDILRFEALLDPNLDNLEHVLDNMRAREDDMQSDDNEGTPEHCECMPEEEISEDDRKMEHAALIITKLVDEFSDKIKYSISIRQAKELIPKSISEGQDKKES